MSYDKLIAGYLAHAGTVMHNYQDSNYWAYEALEALIQQDAETAWSVVIKIIQSVHNDEILEYVSAGILEDLICEHSDVLIERIETLAQAETKFKKALSNVWGWNRMPSDVRARLDLLIKDQPHNNHSQ
jgi:hypothetical protein